MPRGERVQRAEAQRDGQGQGGEAGGEVMSGDQGVQGAGEPVGAARQHGRGGRVTVPFLPGQGGSAGAQAEGRRGDAGRGGQQLLRVARQFAGRRRLGHVGGGEGRTVAAGRDLAPAGADVRAAEADGRPSVPGQRSRQQALHAEGVEARLPRPDLSGAGDDGERGLPPADGDLAVPGGPRAALPGPAVQAQPLDVRPGLRRRDLGEVLDVLDAQVSGGGDQPVVLVDGEVAQRMRAGLPGGQQDEHTGRQGGRGEVTESHAVASRLFSAARASRAPRGEKPGSSSRARVREARASPSRPRARSIMPRW
ncbi:hypothetical protein SGLAM104S_00911 [Streptomyces glaucescens]